MALLRGSSQKRKRAENIMFVAANMSAEGSSSSNVEQIEESPNQEHSMQASSSAETT